MRQLLKTGDTIFSLASGRLPSAVAVIKLSGPLTFTIAGKLFRGTDGAALARDRGMFFGHLTAPSGKFLDEILLLSFVGPHSHTGEDVIEFHCHGSRAVVEAVEEALTSLGARPAEKGEFTYRALLNGKTTPEKVEELADLFQATRPNDLSAIFSRRDASLVRDIEQIRSHLVRLRAVLETSIDFSEEYSHVLQAIHEPIRLAIHECSVVIHRYSAVKTLGNEPRIVLAGAPNAGKSSLFNALLGRYRSIVRAEPGTTRDVLEETIELAGRPWRLVDTAGVRDGAASIESEGIELARDYLSSAAFWVLVVDGTAGMGPHDERLLAEFGDRPHLVLWNKSDLSTWTTAPFGAVALSITRSEAVTAVAKTLAVNLEALSGGETGVIPTQVEVQRLSQVFEALHAIQKGAESEPPEILAERSREVLSLLESVIGEVTLDDVLDRVFSEFCIGK